MKKLMLLTAMLLVAASLVFATGSSEEAGRVTVYTTLDEELAREVFNAFTEETGIQVDWVRLSTGEAVARIEAERDNPQASLWYGGVGLSAISRQSRKV